MPVPDFENNESMEKIYGALGRPEKLDDYKLDIDESINEYLDNDIMDSFKETAHKIGLNNNQLSAIFEIEKNRIKMYEEQQIRNQEESHKILKEQWGPDYDNRIAGAKAAVAAYSQKYPSAVEELVNSPVGNNPALIAMLSELGKAVKESPHAFNSSAPQYGMSSEDARDKINEIMQNKSHAYFNDSDPSHGDAVNKVQRLYKVAYPDG